MTNLTVLTVIVLFLAGIAAYRAAFEQGSGPVLLSYVRCTGTEVSLLDCSHQIIDYYRSNYNDAGVVCLSCKLCV